MESTNNILKEFLDTKECVNFSNWEEKMGTKRYIGKAYSVNLFKTFAEKFGFSDYEDFYENFKRMDQFLFINKVPKTYHHYKKCICDHSIGNNAIIMKRDDPSKYYVIGCDCVEHFTDREKKHCFKCLNELSKFNNSFFCKSCNQILKNKHKFDNRQWIIGDKYFKESFLTVYNDEKYRKWIVNEFNYNNLNKKNKIKCYNDFLSYCIDKEKYNDKNDK